MALIAALASDADLLILDEPTSGLDPLMEAAFRECIEEERQGGRTVLLSSHILSEVEALCDRVTIIRAGRTVETGTLAELRHLTRTSIAAELAGPPAGLDALPGVHDLVVDTGPAADGRRGRSCRVRCEVDADQLAELLRRLVAAGVRSLVSQPPTLEELFLRHYAADPADPAERRGRRAARGAVGVSAATLDRAAPAAEAGGALAGVRELARLAVRRDRIMLPVWIYVAALITARDRLRAARSCTRPGPAARRSRSRSARTRRCRSSTGSSTAARWAR